MHKQAFIEEMKGELEGRKAQLLEEIAGLRVHTEVGTDYDENATEIQIDNVNQDLIGRIQEDLQKIDAALSKIAAGTYGVDDKGKEISEQRLRALPWADKAI